MRPLRVVTYNIHKGRGLDGRTRIDRIARVLEDIDADIVALQEVVSHSGRGAEHDQAGYLARRLGLHLAVGEVRQHRGGVYGNVTLSRWAFHALRVIDITVAGREERAVLRTDVRPGGHLLHVFNVHLGTGFFERRRQAGRFLETDLLRALDLSGPRILLGDFNEWVQGLVSHTLRREFQDPDLRDYLPRRRTYPGPLPLFHLDHIYFDNHIEVESARFINTPRTLTASDHLPLVADLRLRHP